MSVYAKTFKKILREEMNPGFNPNMEPSRNDPDQENAMSGFVDEDNPVDLYNDVPTDNPKIQYQKEETRKSVDTLKTWVKDVEDFINYLNGLDETSINFILNRADCDSILHDVRRSESKKISRIAQELSSLGESLKQYLLSATKQDDN